MRGLASSRTLLVDVVREDWTAGAVLTLSFFRETYQDYVWLIEKFERKKRSKIPLRRFCFSSIVVDKSISVELCNRGTCFHLRHDYIGP